MTQATTSASTIESIRRDREEPPIAHSPLERVTEVTPSYTDPNAAPGLAMTIPGSAESAAEKVNQVSPEGRPARMDAKAGPGRMAMEVVVVAIVVMIAAVGIGLWFGWVAGVASLGVGLLALMFNPVIGAVAMRMEDRAEVIQRDAEGPTPR